MGSMLSESMAATVIMLDEAGGASLTEIARAIGKPPSTVQRAIESLVRSDAVRRESDRGPFVFRPSAPRRALRELAEWRLGRERSRHLQQVAGELAEKRSGVPRTITNQRIRTAWPSTLNSIVAAYDPVRVILFGSQARGDAGPDSDVDLLVVFDEKVDRRERQVEIRRLLRDAPFAKDVLVASTVDLPNAARGTAIAEAIHEGVVVYER